MKELDALEVAAAAYGVPDFDVQIHLFQVSVNSSRSVPQPAHDWKRVWIFTMGES